MPEINEVIGGRQVKLHTTQGLFSPSSIDRGTLAMLSQVKLQPTDKVLDLGCGSGVVGIWAAFYTGADKVIMCDISEEAVRCASRNAEQNGFGHIKIIISDGLNSIEDRDFTLILSNPPYHTDFSVAKGFIEEGIKHLVTGGRMMMVTKRREWYENKLRTVFGGVKVFEIDGYFVFLAEKREAKRKQPDKLKKGMSKKLLRKEAARKANRLFIN